ncbi:glycosyltransferase family 92 protein [Gracilimonas sp. BCB1]|uniref:glycosyltransferase family 92 protein n=1 Tax=Gracilimonas sp. BCB1 TaxID=3152362 RepID=UPI0032D8C759
MKKYFLSFVSNFKNENPYLKEWLDYHIKVGVDHFYLFNQCGSDESWRIIEPYKKSGIVTVHDWTNISSKYEGPTNFLQKNKNHMAYNHAAKNYRKDTEWLLKIDLDEFLFMANEEYTIKSWLYRLRKDAIRKVRVPRMDFGDNGHAETPHGGVLKNYTRREETPSNYKDMANTDFLSDNKFNTSSHRWSFKWFSGGKTITPNSINELRINHYYTKSKEEYFNRQNISRGRNVSEDDFKAISDRTNKVRDRSILRHLPLLSEN